MPAIIVDALRKSYVTTKKSPGLAGAVRSLFSRESTLVEAVKDVSFTIDDGELVGFLGPNGAGKTTTLKMLSGILFPTSGIATILGHVPWKRDNAFLRQISLVMGQKNQLWWDLPAADSFLLLKEIYEVPDTLYRERLSELTELLELGALLNTQVRKLSLGERMKCELVAALLYAPRVIFLDEPTIGLDVVSQKRIRQFLRDYQKRNGCTIVLTSHYMQDIQELCDRVIIIDRGEKIFDDRLATLVREFSDVRLLKLEFSESVDSPDLAAYGRVVGTVNGRTTIEVARDQVTATAAQILSRLPVSDIAIEEVEADEVIRQIFTREKQSA